MATRNASHRRPRKGERAPSGLLDKLNRAEKQAKKGRQGPAPVLPDGKRQRPRQEGDNRTRSQRAVPRGEIPDDDDDLPEVPVRRRVPVIPVEEAWDGTLDPPLQQDVEHALTQSLTAQRATESDVDRLWDWIRADADKGQRFLGMVPATSTVMRGQLLKVFTGHLYALYDEGLDGVSTHVGFAAFGPVNTEIALTHLYLSQDARGKAPQLIPQMVELAQEAYPGLTLAVQTEDVALARLVRGAGFTMAYLLKLAPTTEEPAAAFPEVDPPAVDTDGEEHVPDNDDDPETPDDSGDDPDDA